MVRWWGRREEARGREEGRGNGQEGGREGGRGVCGLCALDMARSGFRKVPGSGRVVLAFTAFTSTPLSPTTPVFYHECNPPASPSPSSACLPPQGFVRSTTKYWVRNEDVSTVKHHVLQHLPVFQFDKNIFSGDAQVRTRGEGEREGEGEKRRCTAGRKDVRGPCGHCCQRSSWTLTSTLLLASSPPTF